MKNGKLEESDFHISTDGLHAWICGGWGTKEVARKWLKEAIEKM